MLIMISLNAEALHDEQLLNLELRCNYLHRTNAVLEHMITQWQQRSPAGVSGDVASQFIPIVRHKFSL